MSSEQSEGFVDNWAYLKMELRWLDQVLMLAVARQRKENHELDRVTHAKADRATSAWWKGIISTEGKAVYDEYRQPSSSGGTKITYQQQLESKIQASQQQGVPLALPSLRDRLGLTLFEKNLILMSLAPEINRRYARLYRYLQGEETTTKTDLPTLDLVLRLMCRNDTEWRDARQRLVTTSPLLQHQLLYLSPDLNDSLLNCPLKLSDSLVNYLLAEHPTDGDLAALLRATPVPLVRSPYLIRTESAVNWSDLVLPSSLLSALQTLAQGIQGQTQAVAHWGMQPDWISSRTSVAIGTIALFAGATGTGKTTAAAAIAHSLNRPLNCVELDLIDPKDYPKILEDTVAEAPTVLLVKSAQLWFGRSSNLPPHLLHQFLSQRQKTRGITLLSVRQVTAVQFQWRQRVASILIFPLPTPNERQQLWRQAFPPEIPLSADIEWEALAKLPLSGGEIMAIAQAAVFGAATEAEQIEMRHLVQVLGQRSQKLQRSLTANRPSNFQTNTSIAQKPKKSRTPTSRSKPAKVTQPKADTQKISPSGATDSSGGKPER